jgi:hypothetical protein
MNRNGSFSRQAFHQKRVFLDQRIAKSMLALDLVEVLEERFRD